MISARIKKRLGAAIGAPACLLLFGGAGAFFAWAIGATIHDGLRAGDWVRVEANVQRVEAGQASYSYEWQGKRYFGDRAGTFILGGTSEVDDWDDRMDALLTAAVEQKKPITAWVNPDNPSESMIDREIRWKLLLVFVPFAVGFGGAGLAAFILIGRQALGFGRGGGSYALKRARLHGGDDPRRQSLQSAGAGALTLWVFAFFWNVISFPIALIAVPEIVKSGEWLGLLVLLFPLIGLFLIWAAVKSTWTAIRRGGAEIKLQPAVPRLGEVVGGNVTFKRGVTAGDAFKARLECITVDKGSPLAHWKAEKETRVIQGPQGPRLAFSFATPDRLPALAGERDEKTTWKLELYKPGQKEPAYAFAFELAPPLGAEHESEEEHEEALAEEAELAIATPMAAGVQNLLKVMGGEEKLAAMSAKDRLQLKARMDAMTPELREAVAKLGNYAHYIPLVKKLAFWAIGLFIAVQVLGVIVAIFFSS